VRVEVVPVPADPVADAGVDLEVCAGQPFVLDPIASAGCDPLGLESRWRDGASVVCDWGPLASCPATTLATTTYSLDVRCAAGECAPRAVSSDEIVVSVSVTDSGPSADAGPAAEICAGESLTLDGTASSGCSGATREYRWSLGATVVCDWSMAATCDVAPAVDSTFTLEVRCVGAPCASPATSIDTVAVEVKPAGTPADIGNTLLAVRDVLDADMLWQPEPLSHSYDLHRSTIKGIWPAMPFRRDVPGPATRVDDVASPPLLCYRVSGVDCGGLVGP